jgi:hypothetical protein
VEEIKQIDGVVGCTRPHFWTFVNDDVVASLHVQIDPAADSQVTFLSLSPPLSPFIDILRKPSILNLHHLLFQSFDPGCASNCGWNSRSRSTQVHGSGQIGFFFLNIFCAHIYYFCLFVCFIPAFQITKEKR